MSEAVKQLEHALKDQPQNPLRNHQVLEYTQEKDRLNSVASGPAWVTGANRGKAAQQARQLSKMVDDQIAKPVQGEKKDLIAKLAEEVMESTIRPALVPREDMRRNPAGSVGRFMRVENAKPIKQAIQQWKRAQLVLEPGNEDPDLANVERFRPERINDTNGAATFMANAQIPGHFAMTARAKENWPTEMPPQGTVNSPLAQAQKKERTPAQIEALARAQAAAKARRDAAKVPVANS